jgi:trk system potassium uptake protein TrkA
MRVVILGGGRIGRYIARDMARRRHDVVIIERVPGRCEELVAEGDVLVIEGDACDVEYLEQARTEGSVFVATTHEDDDNLVACQLAIEAGRAERAISRVNVPENVEIFELLGIEPVSSTRLISELIEEGAAISGGGLSRLGTLRGGRTELVTVRVPGDAATAPPVRRLRDVRLPAGTVVVAIQRDDDTLLPDADTTIEPDDEVVLLTVPANAEQVALALTGRAS